MELTARSLRIISPWCLFGACSLYNSHSCYCYCYCGCCGSRYCSFPKHTHTYSSEEDQAAEASWLAKENDDKVNEQRQSLKAQLAEDLHPTRRWFHNFCIVINCITIFAAFNMGIGQFIGIAYGASIPQCCRCPLFIVRISRMILFFPLQFCSFLCLWSTSVCFFSVFPSHDPKVDMRTQEH